MKSKIELLLYIVVESIFDFLIVCVIFYRHTCTIKILAGRSIRPMGNDFVIFQDLRLYRYQTIHAFPNSISSGFLWLYKFSTFFFVLDVNSIQGDR